MDVPRGTRRLRLRGFPVRIESDLHSHNGQKLASVKVDKGSFASIATILAFFVGRDLNVAIQYDI